MDLVILDYKMPGINGLVAFNLMRDINPQIHAILTSGFIDETELKGMLAQGLKGFIPKPLTQGSFLSKVRAVLEAKPCLTGT